jgi:hypothetical protein
MEEPAFPICLQSVGHILASTPVRFPSVVLSFSFSGVCCLVSMSDRGGSLFKAVAAPTKPTRESSVFFSFRCGGLALPELPSRRVSDPRGHSRCSICCLLLKGAIDSLPEGVAVVRFLDPLPPGRKHWNGVRIIRRGTISQVVYDGGKLLPGIPDALGPLQLNAERIFQDTSSYVCLIRTSCKILAAGLFQERNRYVVLSRGIRSWCSTTISNCSRNSGHEVDPSNLGACSATTPVPAPPPPRDPRSSWKA